MIRSITKHRYFKGKGAKRSVNGYINYITHRPGPDQRVNGRLFFAKTTDDINFKEVKSLIGHNTSRGALAHELIFSPGVQGVDPKRYTRELMHRLEQSMGLQLKWAATAHKGRHNHIHVLIDGVDANGIRVRIGKKEYMKLRQWGDRYLDREHHLERYLVKEVDLNLPFQRETGDELYESLFENPSKRLEEDPIVQERIFRSKKFRSWDKEKAIAELPDEEKIYHRNKVFHKFNSLSDLEAFAYELRKDSTSIANEQFQKLESWIEDKRIFGDDHHERLERERLKANSRFRKKKNNQTQENDESRKELTMQDNYDDAQKRLREQQEKEQNERFEEEKREDEERLKQILEEEAKREQQKIEEDEWNAQFKQEEEERRVLEDKLRQERIEEEQFLEDRRTEQLRLDEERITEEEERERLHREDHERRDQEYKEAQEQKGRDFKIQQERNARLQARDMRNLGKGWKNRDASALRFVDRPRKQRLNEERGRQLEWHIRYQNNMRRQELQDGLRDAEKQEELREKLEELNKSEQEELKNEAKPLSLNEFLSDYDKEKGSQQENAVDNHGLRGDEYKIDSATKKEETTDYKSHIEEKAQEANDLMRRLAYESESRKSYTITYPADQIYKNDLSKKVQQLGLGESINDRANEVTEIFRKDGSRVTAESSHEELEAVRDELRESRIDVLRDALSLENQMTPDEYYAFIRQRCDQIDPKLIASEKWIDKHLGVERDLPEEFFKWQLNALDSFAKEYSDKINRSPDSFEKPQVIELNEEQSNRLHDLLFKEPYFLELEERADKITELTAQDGSRLTPDSDLEKLIAHRQALEDTAIRLTDDDLPIDEIDVEWAACDKWIGDQQRALEYEKSISNEPDSINSQIIKQKTIDEVLDVFRQTASSVNLHDVGEIEREADKIEEIQRNEEPNSHWDLEMGEDGLPVIRPLDRDLGQEDQRDVIELNNGLPESTEHTDHDDTAELESPELELDRELSQGQLLDLYAEEHWLEEFQKYDDYPDSEQNIERLFGLDRDENGSREPMYESEMNRDSCLSVNEQGDEQSHGLEKSDDKSNDREDLSRDDDDEHERGR